MASIAGPERAAAVSGVGGLGAMGLSWTPAGIARVMQVGAQGAMLGTRFVATRENRAHPTPKASPCEGGGWGRLK